MTVIIKRHDGKPVFNCLNITQEEEKKALALDRTLATLVPEIEGKWLSKRGKQGSGGKIDVELAYNIGKKLATVVDNKSLVSPSERKWVWKAIRELHLKDETVFKKRERTRDDLEYLYKVSKYPLEFVKRMSWDTFSRLLDSPSIRQDERFESWFQRKAKQTTQIKRGFLRRFAKYLYALVKNKDTTVLSDKELYKLYETAWRSASSNG